MDNINTSKMNESKWRPKFVSEFSMGALDFERYNQWLKYTEYWSAEINSCDVPSIEMVQKYFAGLNILYKNWRPIIALKPVIDDLDEAIKLAKKEKRKWENSIKSGVPFSRILIQKIVDLLDDINTRLLYVKQVIGLGIVVKKNLTAKQRIKKGMGTGKFPETLPEP